MRTVTTGQGKHSECYAVRLSESGMSVVLADVNLPAAEIWVHVEAWPEIVAHVAGLIAEAEKRAREVNALCALEEGPDW